ncbi:MULTISPECIES: D-amino-acid transaminase [Bacillus]|uniref:D-alanine aminotransferase n=2 Tax=Bacillus TaxID=1386 RepID=A0A0M4G6P3_9BACI|nr:MULTISPECIES: D-amino-acid transaminase [Bacillus]ALC80583.1 D-alanine aminotransferase [Bacillus gobiensis]MBP1083673.1 D-alanine transaminase [Bacillus capparidis]MED1094865.1 D-amino-acid transaminase [Bacillus capparidis]
MKVLWNGSIMDRSESKVDIEDRGYQFGDGVYEVIRIYNGEMFAQKEHIDRLFNSANEIGIELAFEKKDLEQQFNELIQENQVSEGGIYFQISRGVAPRKHQYKKDIQPQTVGYTFSLKKPEEEQTNGVAAITAQDMRWLRCDIKSLNLLYNVMTKQKASEQGAFEAVLIRDGYVTEGTSSNIFAVKDGEVYTHPVNHLILNGITRRELLNIFENEHIPFEEKAITEEELGSVDELFMASTTAEVIPIITLDGKDVGSGKPGNVTRKVQEAFQKRIVPANIVKQ